MKAAAACAEEATMRAAHRRHSNVMLSFTTMASLAEAVEKVCASDTIHIVRDCTYDPEAIRWDSFEDGFPNLFIKRSRDLGNHDVIFLADFSNPSFIFAQLAALYQIPTYLARSLTVILPYFATGTMEV